MLSKLSNPFLQVPGTHGLTFRDFQVEAPLKPDRTLPLSPVNSSQPTTLPRIEILERLLHSALPVIQHPAAQDRLQLGKPPSQQVPGTCGFFLQMPGIRLGIGTTLFGFNQQVLRHGNAVGVEESGVSRIRQQWLVHLPNGQGR